MAEKLCHCQSGLLFCRLLRAATCRQLPCSHCRGLDAVALYGKCIEKYHLPV